MRKKIKVFVYYGDLSEALVQHIRDVSERIEVAVVNDGKSALEAFIDAEVVFGKFNKELFQLRKGLGGCRLREQAWMFYYFLNSSSLPLP